MKFKLIGAKTCPFVQRCLIALLIKEASFETEFINLDEKPDWFLKLSPTGKVPVLLIDNTEILFESAVINEFLDQIIPPVLFASTPMQQAKNRSWIEFSASLMVNLFTLVTTQEEAKVSSTAEQLAKGFAWLETANIGTPYFNSHHFSLVDIAFAPLFYRLKMLSKYYPLDFYQNHPAILQWSENVLKHPKVMQTMSDEYEKLIIANFKRRQGILARHFPDA